MVDLHLHFDGSLPVEAVWEQAKKQGVDLGVESLTDLKEKLSISEDCKSLNEYLEKFDFPLSVLQTIDGISECMQALIAKLVEEEMVYAEIRFAPQLHCLKGLTQDEVVQAAIDGVKKACEGQEIKIKLILCCMRSDDNAKQNLETVTLTKKYLGDIVCACDLAGAEAIFKTSTFEELFAYAKSLEVPYTIHAGEADGPSSIYDALRFGTKRIGHGVHCIEDKSLVELLFTQGITLECCPISNLHTKTVIDMKDHPIMDLLQKGLKVTINSDNRTVSDTNVAKEVDAVRKSLGLTLEQELQLYINALDAAFIKLEEKNVLKEKIKSRF
ncbi:MAG: adenosine deaminase [Lachnospiraceae bacterium]